MKTDIIELISSKWEVLAAIASSYVVLKRDFLATKLGIKKDKSNLNAEINDKIWSNFDKFQNLLDSSELRYQKRIKNLIADFKLIENEFKKDIEALKEEVTYLRILVDKYKDEYGEIN